MCSVVIFSEARARSARAFLGLDRRAWERATVRHLFRLLVIIGNLGLVGLL